MKLHASLTAFAIALLVLKTVPGFAADPDAPIIPTGKARVKLAAIGDSITAGYGMQNPRTDSYPSQLGQMLGTQWQVKNFGASGSTLLNHGDRPYQKTGMFRMALAFKPDVVVILLGTNDSKQTNWINKSEFVADYKDLIGKFKALESHPHIFICHPPFVVGAGAFGINEPGVLEEIPLIDQIAKEENVGVIDIHDALKDKPDFFKDRVHPKFPGATVLAETFYKALTGKAYVGAAPTPGPIPTPKPPRAAASPSPASANVPNMPSSGL